MSFSFQATFYMQLFVHPLPPTHIPPTSIQSCNNNDESFTPAIANSVHKVAPVNMNLLWIATISLAVECLQRACYCWLKLTESWQNFQYMKVGLHFHQRIQNTRRNILHVKLWAPGWQCLDVFSIIILKPLHFPSIFTFDTFQEAGCEISQPFTFKFW